MTPNVFLKRVVLANYRSIGNADVRLGPLTYLVGRNGAGKSNFLDALRLVSESLNAPLELALRDRGGIGEVRRRSGGHPTHFGVRLEMSLSEGARPGMRSRWRLVPAAPSASNARSASSTVLEG